MKSYNHLYEKMISKENIILAIRNAAKGKHDRPVVQAVLRDVETHATRVVELIESGEIKPQKHKGRIMYDSRRAKNREITQPYFLRNATGEYCYEQIIQHAIVQVLSPIIMRSIYRHSYGSIPGRGCHNGKQALEGYIRKHSKEVRYVLKADIRHFYESVQTSLLKAYVRCKIHDEK